MKAAQASPQMAQVGPETSTPPAPKTRKSNRVSQPRKKGVRKVKLNFNVPVRTREKLEEAALRHDSSLSELLTGALERCLKDDAWSPKVRSAVSRNRTIVPPAELVDISNQLLALASVLERLMQTASDPAAIDEASRIHLDARVRLQEMREAWGC